MTKDSQNVNFIEINSSDKNSKKTLWLRESIVIRAHYVSNLEVYRKDAFQGDLFIEAGGRYQPAKEHAIPRIIIELRKDKPSYLPIFNLSGKDLQLSAKHPIALAFPCQQDHEKGEYVLSVKQGLPSLEEGDLNIGTTDVSIREKLLQLMGEFRNCFGDSETLLKNLELPSQLR